VICRSQKWSLPLIGPFVATYFDRKLNGVDPEAASFCEADETDRPIKSRIADPRVIETLRDGPDFGLYSMESQITDRLAARSAAREASGEESCPPPDDPDATKVIGPFEFRRYPNEHEAGLLVHRSRVRELEIVLRTNVFRSDAEKLLSELRAALRTFPDLPRLRLFLGSYVGQHAAIAHYSHGNDQAAFWADTIGFWADRHGGLRVTGLENATAREACPITVRQIVAHAFGRLHSLRPSASAPLVLAGKEREEPAFSPRKSQPTAVFTKFIVEQPDRKAHPSA
jgi:hypothetical protein